MGFVFDEAVVAVGQGLVGGDDFFFTHLMQGIKAVTAVGKIKETTNNGKAGMALKGTDGIETLSGRLIKTIIPNRNDLNGRLLLQYAVIDGGLL